MKKTTKNPEENREEIPEKLQNPLPNQGFATTQAMLSTEPEKSGISLAQVE